jgi:hypothetical protein
MTDETTDAVFLAEIANWIFYNVSPSMGLDQYHSDRLMEISRRLEAQSAA